MAINYFIGWNQKRLEEALCDAQEDLAAGKDTLAAGSGDAHVQSKIEISPQQRIQMILKALNLLDPATYPPSMINAITQTRVSFNSGCN